MSHDYQVRSDAQRTAEGYSKPHPLKAIETPSGWTNKDRGVLQFKARVIITTHLRIC